LNIYIGTCGFSYPDWDGHFYPPEMPARDRLHYYADRFRTVELDSLFYHIPGPDIVEKMVKKARKEFRFNVKLHRSITHDFDLSAAEFSGYKRAIAPIINSGKLGAILAQFPPAFHCERDSVQMLRTIREEFEDLPLTVEFRHKSWNRPETFEFLRKQKIAYCAVDELNLPDLLPPVVRRTADFVYVRLHGRNAATWFNARTAAERHNYLYSDGELDSWAVQIQEAAREANAVYVLFSNVHEGKGALNARQLAIKLGLPAGPAFSKPASSGQIELALT
jgi:uncharacterized protein YecE (DUF72 family)